MADIVTLEKRSQMMTGIKGSNTKPEKIIKSILNGKGFRFRLHDKKLPGKPDLVFQKHKSGIFVNGCFWHGHHCHLFKMPSSNTDFWLGKINQNRERDLKIVTDLTDLGWKVHVVWECALRGKKRQPIELLAAKCSDWLVNWSENNDIRGL